MSTETLDSAIAEDKPNREVGVLLPLLEAVCKSQRQLLNLKLSKLDILVGQDQFLLAFEDDRPIAVSDLADRVSVRSSTVSKMADRLQEKGWVKRSSNAADARRVMLQLTDAGWKVREAVRELEAEIEADLLQTLGAKAQVITALAELDEALTKRLRRLR